MTKSHMQFFLITNNFIIGVHNFFYPGPGAALQFLIPALLIKFPSNIRVYNYNTKLLHYERLRKNSKIRSFFELRISKLKSFTFSITDFEISKCTNCCWFYPYTFEVFRIYNFEVWYEIKHKQASNQKQILKNSSPIFAFWSKICKINLKWFILLFKSSKQNYSNLAPLLFTHLKWKLIAPLPCCKLNYMTLSNDAFIWRYHMMPSYDSSFHQT